MLYLALLAVLREARRSGKLRRTGCLCVDISAYWFGMEGEGALGKGAADSDRAQVHQPVPFRRASL